MAGILRQPFANLRVLIKRRGQEGAALVAVRGE